MKEKAIVAIVGAYIVFLFAIGFEAVKSQDKVDREVSKTLAKFDAMLTGIENEIAIETNQDKEEKAY